MGSGAARILLVEDDADHRDCVTDMLLQEGHAVVGAATAEEALQHLDAGVFDLVISDYQLGGATGAWLARVVALARGPRLLLMTGYRDLAGVEGLDLVTKPLDFDGFVTKVGEMLALGRASAPRSTCTEHRIRLELYVDESLPSRRATRRVRDVLSRYREDQVALTVTSISATDDPELDRVVCTPTLVKTFPAPRVWIAGDLGDGSMLEDLLAGAGAERRSGST
jgi:DNA-binding response OmpR family regulator